jgi:hypothetical protein
MLVVVCGCVSGVVFKVDLKFAAKVDLKFAARFIRPVSARLASWFACCALSLSCWLWCAVACQCQASCSKLT